jgi:hypothetical protein
METYSSWVNRPKEKCVSADLMHLLLVSFVTVKLTYIFIDYRYPVCEYIIIFISLAKLHLFNAHI